MSRATDDDVPLVSLADIAKLTRVTRPAVSNWRKRHKDFPQPIRETGAVSLFRLDEIQAWLTKHGKKQVMPTARQAVWAALHAGRGSTTIAHSVEACVLVLGMYVLNGWVDTDGRLSATYHADDPVELIRSAARVVGEQLQLFYSRSSGVGEVDVWKAAPVVAELPRLVREHGIVEICEALLAEVSERQGKAGGVFVTPPTIADLAVALAGPIKGLVYDPACGWGNTLLAAYRKRSASASLCLAGAEINPDAHVTATLRLLIHGIPSSIALRNSTLKMVSREADLVFTDPPFSGRNEEDRAWIERTLHHLGKKGRGFHVSPQGLLFRPGLYAELRRQLVSQGSVEAVITLPAGLYSNTGIPVALWILRPPSTISSEQVLLLDASQLGSRKRLQVELSESDIKQVVECHSAWENGHALPQADNLPCVAIPSERLLQGDCQFLVQRWEVVTVDPKKQITRVRNASTGLREAITSLSVPKQLGLLQASPSPSRTLQELIDSGHAELIRGIRVPLELVGKGSTPIIGLGDFRDDWRVIPSTTADLTDFDRDVPISKPGDVLIAAEGKKIFTAVAVKGGAVVTAPLQCLRLHEQSMDRSLVLAVLLPETLGRCSGSPSYADIRNLEVLWPNNEQCARVVCVLRAVVTQRRAAQVVANAADELVNSTVDALMAGALPVDNWTESVVTPR